MRAMRSKNATSTMKARHETNFRMDFSLLSNLRQDRRKHANRLRQSSLSARPARAGDQLPTRTVPDAAQFPGLVPMAAPDVLNRTTPVWSEQKARLPVTSTADGFALTSKALRAPFEGVLPAAWKV